MKFVDSQSPGYVRAAVRSLVSMRPHGRNMRLRGESIPASGFYVGDDLIVTARHVAQWPTARIYQPGYRALDVLAGRLDGAGLNVAITIQGTSAEYDIAFYSVFEETRIELPPLRIGRSAFVDEPLLLLGVTHRPRVGYVAKYSEGALRDVRQRPGEPALLLFDAATQLGASGGPVIRVATGEVIGVLSGTLELDGREYAMAWSLDEGDVPWPPVLHSAMR